MNKPAQLSPAIRQELPDQVAEHIYKMEEYAETLLLQKNYYRRMCIMLLTNIEQGEFTGEGFQQEALALKTYATAV